MTAEAQPQILITGAGGFIGQELVKVLLNNDAQARLLITDIFTPPVPQGYANRVTTQAADLTDPASLRSLIPPSQPLRGVYALHGLMSGGSEANLDLGLSVNLDSHRYLLDHLRTFHSGVRVVFTSSTAVFGHLSELSGGKTPHDVVVTETTQPLPASSYGGEKHIVETLLLDCTRRGLLDGVVVRLPTVIVRPGAPSSAASSFASGIVRETLNAERNVLPVRRDMKMWVCSPDVVVQNLVHALIVGKDRHNEGKMGTGNVFNLPGTTCTVQDILDALTSVVGQETVNKYIEEKNDAVIERIVDSWPAEFDTSWARKLGFRPDVSIYDNIEKYVAKNAK